MARPIRIEFSGALYHVTSRGDRREACYEGDEDRLAFLRVLGKDKEQTRTPTIPKLPSLRRALIRLPSPLRGGSL